MYITGFGEKGPGTNDTIKNIHSQSHTTYILSCIISNMSQLRKLNTWFASICSFSTKQWNAWKSAIHLIAYWWFILFYIFIVWLQPWETEMQNISKSFKQLWHLFHVTVTHSNNEPENDTTIMAYYTKTVLKTVTLNVCQWNLAYWFLVIKCQNL